MLILNFTISFFFFSLKIHIIFKENLQFGKSFKNVRILPFIQQKHSNFQKEDLECKILGMFQKSHFSLFILQASKKKYLEC